MKAIAAVALVILAGCSTPQQRAERVVERFGATCTSMGYPAHTQPWADCIMAMHQQQEAMRMQLIGLGAAMQQQSRPPPQTCFWSGPYWVCR